MRIFNCEFLIFNYSSIGNHPSLVDFCSLLFVICYLSFVICFLVNFGALVFWWRMLTV